MHATWHDSGGKAAPNEVGPSAAWALAGAPHDDGPSRGRDEARRDLSARSWVVPGAPEVELSTLRGGGVPWCEYHEGLTIAAGPNARWRCGGQVRTRSTGLAMVVGPEELHLDTLPQPAGTFLHVLRVPLARVREAMATPENDELVRSGLATPDAGLFGAFQALRDALGRADRADDARFWLEECVRHLSRRCAAASGSPRSVRAAGCCRCTSCPCGHPQALCAAP